MKLPSHTCNAKGFTILEILVVITVIAILTGLTVPTFGRFLTDQNLRQAQDQVVIDMRKIQNRALSGVGYVPDQSAYWGIAFKNGQSVYKYFITNTGANLNAACSQGWTSGEQGEMLPDRVVVRNPGFASGCIFYDFHRGNKTSIPANIQSIIIGRPDGTGVDCMQINLSNAGLILGAQSPVTCGAYLEEATL